MKSLNSIASISILFAFVTIVLGSSPSHAGNAADSCQKIFKAWAFSAKARINHELSLAAKIDFVSGATTNSVDLLENQAKYLCNRLQTISALNFRTDKPNLVANCVMTFSDWEDAMDQAFTQKIFDKDLVSEIAKYTPAQDTHRREAAMAVQLCKLLE